jgi:NADPH-dependent curcumin reductase
VQTGQRIVLASRPASDPKATDLRLEEFALPAPDPGEVLLKTKWLSLDPYMRGRMIDGPSYAKACRARRRHDRRNGERSRHL